MRQRNLLTGVDGFLGRRLFAGFRAAKADVHGAGLGDCDLLDPAAVVRLLDRVSPEGVVHAAGSLRTSALGPVGGYFNCVSSTLNLLRGALCLGVKKIGFLCSNAVYGKGYRAERGGGCRGLTIPYFGHCAFFVCYAY